MEPNMNETLIGYASYESYPIPTEFSTYYEPGHRVREFILITSDPKPGKYRYTRTVNIWACGCIGNMGRELRAFAPGEKVRISKIALKCDHHSSPLSTPTRMSGDEELKHLVLPARDTVREMEPLLPPLRPVKHVSFSTEKPDTIGLGAYGLNMPSKDVRSVKELRKAAPSSSHEMDLDLPSMDIRLVKTPRRAVATTFDEMKWVKPMENKNSTRWKKAMKKVFNCV